MPNNNPGDNRLGWSVNAGNGSGGLQRGIFGAALNALGQARRTQQRLHEFDYKENAKRETYIQRKAADQAGHVMKVNTNTKAVTDMARRHGKTKDADGNTIDRPNFNFNAVTGAMSYSIPSTYTKDLLELKEKERELINLKNENKSDAKDAQPVNGNKKDRSTKKAEAAANAGDAWAAQPPTPTPSRTTSNITPPGNSVATKKFKGGKVQPFDTADDDRLERFGTKEDIDSQKAKNAAVKIRKPRAPRAPKNPGQSGGMQ